MTITDFTTAPTTSLQAVVEDLYRDIHKGIRAELFAVTERAGSIDPADRDDRSELCGHVQRVAWLLESHAEHEDTHIQPVLERHLPALFEQIERDHHRLEGQVRRFAAQAADFVDAPADPRLHAHRLYLELASFTSTYLAHQDLEERVIMPAIEGAIGVDGCVEVHQAIVGSIPPEDMGRSLAVMLPAMNVDDRADLLVGMQAGAPAEVFEGVWGLATSVLDPRDADALARRLGV